MKMTMKLIAVLMTLMALYGCGGGGNNGSSPVPDSNVFPAGKATITFSAISTAKLPVPISGIDFFVTLPPGMSVTTKSGTPSGQIDDAAITVGAAMSGTNMAYGTYSTSKRKLHLTMATTYDNFRLGEFVRISCNVATGTGITLADLQGLNSPVLIQKAAGFDTTTSSSVLLTDKIKVNIGTLK